MNDNMYDLVTKNIHLLINLFLALWATHMDCLDVSKFVCIMTECSTAHLASVWLQP